MTVARRAVIQAGVAAGLCGLSPVPSLRSLAFAGGSTAQTILVVVHLRGGCDGLNLVSPASDPALIAARASDLRVAVDGPDQGLPLANGPDPKIDFRLHPQAGGLAELYKSGQLALVHAVGLTDGTRSHFVATDMIEHGVADTAGLNHASTGWLCRALGAPNVNTLVAASASGTPSGDLAGLAGALAIADLGGGLGLPGGEPVHRMLQRLYGGTNGAAAEAGRRALTSLGTVDSHVPRGPQQKPLPYQPAEGVKYDGSGEYERALKTVAQLIKMEIGLQALTVDLGGWDTHEYQNGRFRAQVGKLSNGLTAFWNDLAAYHNRMIVVTVTEFGRRLRGNRSGGTDHGRASVMMVLGGKVHGGRFYGTWPGLDPQALDEGVDLKVATDYRQVIRELIDAKAGHRLDSVFPGYRYPGPLGLLA
ncbi:MAG TPA: DUF1501 domain-containing protein [Stellaceae bacterium]|nr:DUF1501 domain-containing protein [Stellaceae bacterium]